ncbi:AT-hook motif nuclear-localized protein 13 isoform X1 [Brassica rapa]|uniref:AT-hook motif nuclear-localized protein n=1 Tax=Brassica campestris TaxID=3711 RepID=M4EAA8_BRACM|nr:AT-hook motif nuclear-localized protein 13 isoform X1 [Brassica rapa]
MDSKETQQQQNRNAAAALAGPTSTSQAMHNRSSVGALSLRQPQALQGVMPDGSPYSASVATQQPWRQVKRGRGRPRKYAPPDGGDSGGGANAGPPARGGEEGSFTAHVININAGEDIAAKLLAFVNQKPRHVCVLSALGDVSVAELSNNPLGLGLVKYEGPYVITAMSGVFSSTESNGTVTTTGNLNVSLAGPDFKTVGGRVGGMLVAGSPFQVIVGSFVPEGVKLSAASGPDNVLNSSGGGGPGLPQSQGPSKSSEENASKSPGNNAQ